MSLASAPLHLKKIICVFSLSALAWVLLSTLKETTELLGLSTQRRLIHIGTPYIVSSKGYSAFLTESGSIFLLLSCLLCSKPFALDISKG